ncbi:hypothetical protein ACVWXM_009723 [Bradyrhizobium sp. GM7.3]
MTRSKNSSRLPKELLRCDQLLAGGSVFIEHSLSTKCRTPITLVAAARPYLKELRQAIGRSRIHAIAGEFGRTISLALEHQPDLILVTVPPLVGALKTCKLVLENHSTKNIPLSLISLRNMSDDTSSVFLKPRAQATPGEFQHRHIVRGNNGEFAAADDNQYSVDGKRQMKLMGLLELLRYAEAEITELDLETSAVLLAATIADVAQNFD